MSENLNSRQNEIVRVAKHDEVRHSPRLEEGESPVVRIMQTVLNGRMKEMAFLCRIMVSHTHEV